MKINRLLIGIVSLLLIASLIYAQEEKTAEQVGEDIGKGIVDVIGAGFSAVGSAKDAINQEIDQDPELSRNKDKIVGLWDQDVHAIRTVKDASDENGKLKKATSELEKALGATERTEIVTTAKDENDFINKITEAMKLRKKR